MRFSTVDSAPTDYDILLAMRNESQLSVLHLCYISLTLSASVSARRAISQS